MIAEHTALYSKLDRMYNKAISGPYEDLSTETTVAAISGGKITGYWRPVIIVDNHMSEMRRLWDISKEIVYHDIEPLSPAARWLLARGYEATPYYNHVLDLQSHLWRDIRKSYQNLINRDSNYCFIDNDVMAFRKVHEELAGRRTRSPESWKVQQLMVDRGEAFLVRKDMGGVFITHNSHWAYYFSGRCQGNSHGLIYTAIEECKRRGLKYLDMGEQVYFGNEKMVNISNFKRGFGGQTRMSLILKYKVR